MNNIKIMRKKAKYTQKNLARFFNIDKSTVSKWETGESMPQAEKLPELARLLNCKIDDLFDSDKKRGN